MGKKWKPTYNVDCLSSELDVNAFVNGLLNFIKNAPNDYTARVSQAHKNVIIVSESAVSMELIAIAVKKTKIEVMAVDRKSFAVPNYLSIALGAIAGLDTFLEIFEEDKTFYINQYEEEIKKKQAAKVDLLDKYTDSKYLNKIPSITACDFNKLFKSNKNKKYYKTTNPDKK